MDEFLLNLLKFLKILDKYLENIDKKVKFIKLWFVLGNCYKVLQNFVQLYQQNALFTHLLHSNFLNMLFFLILIENIKSYLKRKNISVKINNVK